MDITVDILLLPSEYDDSGMCVYFEVYLVLTLRTLAVNSIILENERSTSLIKGISFGILQPGANGIKTLFLISAGLAGDRVLDISVRSRLPADQGEVEEGLDETKEEINDDSTETLHTLTVPAVEPFLINYDVAYRRSTQEWQGLADLKTFSGDYWDGRGGEAVINVRIECPGPWPIEVEGVVLEREVRIFRHNLILNVDIFPAWSCRQDNRLRSRT